MNLLPDTLLKTSATSRFPNFLKKYLASTDEDDIITVRKKSVTLTDAHIKALPTTPIEIVPAPGAGKVIQYLGGTIVVALEADYTDIDDGSAMFFGVATNVVSAYVLDDSGASPAQVNLSNLLAGSGDGVLFVPPYSDFASGWGLVAAGQSGVTNVANQPLTLRLDFGTGNLTGGDATNTMKVTVLYTIIDV
jgi:hypothetical protein